MESFSTNQLFTSYATVKPGNRYAQNGSMQVSANGGRSYLAAKQPVRAPRGFGGRFINSNKDQRGHALMMSAGDGDKEPFIGPLDYKKNPANADIENGKAKVDDNQKQQNIENPAYFSTQDYLTQNTMRPDKDALKQKELKKQQEKFKQLEQDIKATPVPKEEIEGFQLAAKIDEKSAEIAAIKEQMDKKTEQLLEANALQKFNIWVQNPKEFSALQAHKKKYGIDQKGKTITKKSKKVIEQADFTNYGWLVLFLLVLVRISHQVTQTQLGYIFGFKGDGFKAGNPQFEMRSFYPGMADQYSLLSGPAYSVSYAFAGIFMGMMVDKVNRKMLLAGACLAWGLSSLITGTTSSFFIVYMMRFITGMAVSATEPAAFSILGDYFPKRLRTTANSIMNTSSYLGSGISSLIVLIVTQYGWRAAYQGVGIIGSILAVLAFFVIREPERGFQLKLAFQEKQRKDQLKEEQKQTEKDEEKQDKKDKKDKKDKDKSDKTNQKSKSSKDKDKDTKKSSNKEESKKGEDVKKEKIKVSESVPGEVKITKTNDAKQKVPPQKDDVIKESQDVKQVQGLNIMNIKVKAADPKKIIKDEKETIKEKKKEKEKLDEIEKIAAAASAPKKKKSKKKKQDLSLSKKFINSLTEILKSPISRYTTMGASFRYFGQFASDYYLPLFYLSNYSTHKAEFALVYSVINMVCGFVSSLAGGLISDKFGKGKPMFKAWVCIAGNMIAMPLFVASVMITDNFWLSISLTALRFLFGEPWRSPSVTMIQNSSDPEKFGNLVSAYQFYQKMSSVVAALIIGALFKRFDVVANPAIIGKILALIGGIAYTGSAVAFYLAGKYYIAFKRNLKYRSIFTFNRKSRGYDSKGFKPFDPEVHSDELGLNLNK